MSRLTDFEDKIAVWWDNTKAFFKRSEVIFYSRLQVVSGFFLAVFSGIDWTTVTVNLENAKQSLYIAAGLIINGIVTEVLRRRNATLPTA
jgi:hypothetical protein